VVEGLETSSQAEVVQALGARAVQGYLFSQPMRACAVAAYLQAATGKADALDAQR
jgi:EAL domain-containing protein (putative c-di-GMP-specific phosphodiesterase class I)